LSTRPRPLRPAPEVGDIVWCRFPEVESIQPGHKPRPCLITWVSEAPADNSAYRIRVVYGTSRLRGAPRETEFDIDPASNSAAVRQAGLSWPTRFSFAKAVVLNYDEMYFAPAPAGPNQPPRNSPKLGTLPPSYFAAARRAHDAVTARGKRRS
jgi:hypothetical protein